MKKTVHLVSRFLSVIMLLGMANACTSTQGQDSDNQPTATGAPSPMAALAGVCKGIPVPGAAEYRPNQVPHRVYFVSPAGGSPDWNSQVPRDWLAETVAEVQWVGCIAEQETVIETCSYLPNGLADRIQYETTIRLVAGRTGEEILSLVQPGTPPEACPLSMTFDLMNPKRGSIPGGHIVFPEVQGNLGFYIESPIQPRVIQTELELGFPTLSPDGATLASVGPDGVTSLWDPSTGQLLRTFTEEIGFPLSIAFSPDGTALGIGSYQGTIIILDVRGQQPAREIHKSEEGLVRALAYSPDGKFLVSSDKDQVVFWDAITLKEVDRLNAPYPSGLAFSPDGSKLAAIGLSGVTIWDLAAGDKIPTFVEKWPEPSDELLTNPFLVNRLAFTPDNQALVYDACKQVDWPPCNEAEIRRWNLRSGNWSAPLTGPTFMLQHMDISRDGSMVAGTYCKQFNEATCGVSQIDLWDMATGKSLYSFEQSGWVNGAVFAADNQTLIIVKEKELVFANISWMR